MEVDRNLSVPISHKNELTFSIRPFGIKTIRVIPAQRALPFPPTGVRAGHARIGKLILSWKGASDGEHSYYRIYRDTRADFTPSLINCVGTTPRPFYADRPTLNFGGWLDNRIEPTTTYYYRIQAVGPFNTQSSASQPVEAKTLSPREKNSIPNKVLGLAATSVSPITSFNYICLLFYTNCESDVTHYRIHRSETPGFHARSSPICS